MNNYNVGASFESIAIDMAGYFPEDEGGNRDLLTAMGYLTIWAVCAITKDEEPIVADAVVTNFFRRFGFPS
jgi:hypothetical protein